MSAKILKQILNFLIGEFSWNPPMWFRFLKKLLSTMTSWVFSYLSRHKKVAILLLGIIITILGYYHWLETRPKPELVRIQVQDFPTSSVTQESDPHPLEIRFSKPVAKLALVGKKVEKGVVLDPKIDGTWEWQDDTTLIFKPKKIWPTAQEFKGKIEKDIITSKVLLENDGNFTFKTPGLQITIYGSQLYVNPENPKQRQFVTSLKFSHPVDKTSLEKNVNIKVIPKKSLGIAQLMAKNLSFTINYPPNSDTAHIRSENLDIPESDSEIKFEVKDGVMPLFGGAPLAEKKTDSVLLPGKENYFVIKSVSDSTFTDWRTLESKKVLIFYPTVPIQPEVLTKYTEVFEIPYETASSVVERQQQKIESDEVTYYEEDLNEDSYDDSGQVIGHSEEEDVSGDEDYHTDDSWSYEDESQGVCPFTSLSSIPDEILKSAKKIPISVHKNPAYAPEIYPSFTYDAEDGSCLIVKVQKGVKSKGDEILEKEFVALVRPEIREPEVGFVGAGSILSLTGEKQLTIWSKNISHLYLKIYRVIPDFIHFLGTQTWGPYPEPNFKYNFDPYQISEVFEKTFAVPRSELNKPSYTTINLDEYIASNHQNPRGLFLVSVSPWNPKLKKKLGISKVKLVLLTDLGFLIKEHNSRDSLVFVVSLVTGDPVPEATVKVLGANGLPVITARTDQDGIARIPDTNDFKKEKKPTLLVVEKEADLAFMPLRRFDRFLNQAKFDIGGIRNVEPDSLEAFIFNDRGIYRPGEEIRFGLIAKKRNWQPLPSGLGLTLKILDPRSSTIHENLIKMDSNGFAEYKFKVNDDALTGKYRAILAIQTVGGRNNSETILHSSNFRVDEFLPDRLHVNAQFLSNESPVDLTKVAWISPNNLKAKVSVMNMFGSPAVGYRVKAKVEVFSGFPVIRGFENFEFFRTQSQFFDNSYDLGELETDSNGEAIFNLDFSKFQADSLTARVTFEVFEKDSGRSIVRDIVASISNLHYALGARKYGNFEFIRETDPKGNYLELIAISPELKKVNISSIRVDLVEIQTLSVLKQLSNGNLAYESENREILKESKVISIPETGIKVPIPKLEPGRYALLIFNDRGNQEFRFDFDVVGSANQLRSLEKEVELILNLDKQEYKPGEEIQLGITAPFSGSGLITIEREKVYAYKWFKTDTNSTIQSIKVPEDLEGNAYVSVAFIRDLNSTEIHLSPLSYAVKPFKIALDRRINKITIDAPKTSEPGKEIEFSVASSSPTKALVYAVDDGILQVAGYKRPDPLEKIFRKVALLVNTRQILDLLLPSYSTYSNLLGVGGDDQWVRSKFNNPFKRKDEEAVTFWSGLVDLDETPRKFKFTTPKHFNSTVKIFAVAVNQNQIGVAEEKTVVQSDLVITPNVPPSIGVNDEVWISAVITNVKSQSDQVTISLQTSEHIKILDSNGTKLRINRGDSAVAKFKIKPLDKFGPQTIIFKAKSNSEFVEYPVETSIRPLTQKLTLSHVGVLKPNESHEWRFDYQFYSQEHTRDVLVSSTPFSLIGILKSYLDKFPYGCTEQIVSQAIPIVVLSEFQELSVKLAEVRKNLDRIIFTLGQRQQEDGSFSAWENYTSSIEKPWLTMHVARFLVEAIDRGHRLPTALKTQTIKYLKDFVNETVSRNSYLLEKAYAIYLLTRFGEGSKEMLDEFIAEAQKNDGNWSEDLTGMFIASALRELQFIEQADRIVDEVDLDIVGKGSTYMYDSPSKIAHYLALLARHFPNKLHYKGSQVLEKISDILQKSTSSTISSALSILAFVEYIKATQSETKNEEVKVAEGPDNSKMTPVKLTDGVIKRGSLNQSSTITVIKSNSKLPLFFGILESGYPKYTPTQFSKGIELVKEYYNDEGLQISKASVGDDIHVRLLIRVDNKNISNGPFAIVDIFPTGLENLLKENSVDVDDSFRLHHIQLREDRIIIFGEPQSNTVEILYTLKAVHRGKFKTPPAFAELMYLPSANALTQEGELMIE
ncbi:MAG: MG2 domain-containing protein [Deltaproteobacteria bacterium]|nr:MG2 domain-containing protein [Deltaproteobacteria bacterium]